MTASKRVLIAEDEALIRLDLSEMLAEEGFEVVGQAVDGEQAVTMATELRPDLVIMDVKMPKKDGIDAAAEMYGFGEQLRIAVRELTELLASS